MSELSDEELRRIARNAVDTGVFSGNVKQLRAVFNRGVAAGRANAAVVAATPDREVLAIAIRDALKAEPEDGLSGGYVEDSLDGGIIDGYFHLLTVADTVIRALSEGQSGTVRDRVQAILNAPEKYEYEGLSWNAVRDLRSIFGIPEPSGAWLNPTEGQTGVDY